MTDTQHARGTVIGQMLLGRYRVVRELAKGGMGVLYLGRVEGAVGFVKPVVVKLILPEHASDQRFLGMFAREAQIVSQLRHPSVVDVLEFAEQDGAYIMVLEYVRGHHLGQWSRYLQIVGRRIAPEIATQITIDVLDALHHAHSLSHPDGTPMHIVHRDISPSNIMLDEDGRARLLDFGVARMRGGAIDYQTQVRGFVGKFTYTAPEIFEGGEASPQSDLYACAVVLHETLYGQNVFKGDNQAETMQRALSHVAEPVSSVRADVPEGFDDVLQKALAKSPADRYKTCREFADALRAFLPVSENEMRVALAALLKNDFGVEMAQMLGIESLAERDEAWRKLAQPRRTLNTLAADELRVSIATDEPRPSDPSPRQRTTRSEMPEEDSEASEHTAPRRPARGSLRTRGGTLSADGHPSRAASAPPVRSHSAELASRADLGAAGTGRMSTPAEPKTTVKRGNTVERVVSRAPAATVPQSVPVPSFAAGPRRTYLWTTLFFLLLGSAGVVLLRALKTPAVPPPPYRVVAELAGAGAPGTAPSPHPVSASEPSPQPSTALGAAGAQAELAQKPRARAPTPNATRKPGPDPARLTLAFRQQQAKIEACLSDRGGPSAAQPEIQLEFDLDATGRLQRVQLLPRAFAATAAGACIERVARATKFPKQSRAVSFTIPVRTSRGDR